MATSAAHKLANARYRQNRRKTIAADVSKEKGEMYQAFATQNSLSMSLLVQNGVDEYIANHGGEGVQDVAPVITSEQRKILDAVESLPPDARRALLKILYTLQQGVDEKPPAD